jgi:hypothetical protein
MVAAERASFSGSPILLFLGRTDGEGVRPALDWRGAVGFGAALGLVLALMGAVLRRR